MVGCQKAACLVVRILPPIIKPAAPGEPFVPAVPAHLQCRSCKYSLQPATDVFDIAAACARSAEAGQVAVVTPPPPPPLPELVSPEVAVVHGKPSYRRHRAEKNRRCRRSRQNQSPEACRSVLDCVSHSLHRRLAQGRTAGAVERHRRGCQDADRARTVPNCWCFWSIVSVLSAARRREGTSGREDGRRRRCKEARLFSSDHCKSPSMPNTQLAMGLARLLAIPPFISNNAQVGRRYSARATREFHDQNVRGTRSEGCAVPATFGYNCAATPAPDMRIVFRRSARSSR